MPGNYQRISLDHMTLADVPTSLNLISLPASLILPKGTLPAMITTEQNQRIIEKAFADSRMVGVMHDFTVPEHLSWLKPAKQIGTVARISQIRETSEGLHVVFTGICRFLLLNEGKGANGISVGKIDIYPFSSDMAENYVNIDRKELVAALKLYFASKNLTADWKALEQLENETLITVLPMALPLTVLQQRALLNASSLEERAEAFFNILQQ